MAPPPPLHPTPAAGRHGALPLGLAALCMAALGPLAAGGHQSAALADLVAVNAAAWADIGPRGTNWEGLMTGEAQAAAFALINCLGNTGGFLGSFLMGALRSPDGDVSRGTALLAALLAVASGMSAAYRPPASAAAGGRGEAGALELRGGRAERARGDGPNRGGGDVDEDAVTTERDSLLVK